MTEVAPERRVALITGTRAGIGRGLAEFFLAEGFDVIGCSRGAVEPMGDHYEHHQLDVGDEMAVQSLVAAIGERYGRLDVVVNNAAANFPSLTLATSGASAAEVLRTNVFGTFVVSREAARLMARRQAGRIINFASMAVPLQMQGTAIYSASKAAVIQFTKVLSHELAPFSITCNVIAPSIIATPMTAKLGESVVRTSIDKLAIKRAATLRDITNAVAFFASAESQYVTGQVIYLGLAAP